LSRKALESLFRTRWRGSVAFALEFLGRDGSVLYRLHGEPVTFADLGPDTRRLSVSAEPSFRVDEARDGWQLVDGNAVRVQTRNLRDFASVRVVLRPETLELESGFDLYSDVYWQSLVSHAYRKKSVKISTSGDDPAPSFKELMITDGLFHTGDEELDPVPLLPRNGSIASFALPYGVVYYGDRKSASVAAEWSSGPQRALVSRSESVSGQLNEESVLIFPMPPYRGKNVHFTRSLSFTARSDGSEKTVTVSPDLGLEWDVEPKHNGVRFSDIVMRGDRVYFTRNHRETIAVDGVTGEELWRLSDYGARDFFGRETGPLICSDRNFSRGGTKVVTALDPDSGEKLWERKLSLGAHVPAPGTEVLIFNSGKNLIAIDLETGAELWKSPFPYNTGHKLEAEKSFYCRGEFYFVLELGNGLAHDLFSLNPQNGEMKFLRPNVYNCSSDGKLLYFAESSRREKNSSQAELSLHAAGPSAVAEGKDFLWSSDEAETHQNMFMGEKLLYRMHLVTYELTAIDRESGKKLWTRELDRGTRSSYHDGRIFLSDGGVLDGETGKLYWRWFNREEMGRLLFADEGVVYAGSGEKFDTKVIP
jgi:outer membrane protein assembly factor BamB